MDFFNRNAGAIQAFSALLTVIFAAAALIGVKLQIDATDRIQRAQSARDIYREYLSLAMNKPEFASPDYCKIVNTPQQAGYEYFVEYMLYTAEQTISADAEWVGTFSHSLQDHAQFICTLKDLSGYTDPVTSMISTFQKAECTALPPCGA